MKLLAKQNILYFQRKCSTNSGNIPKPPDLNQLKYVSYESPDSIGHLVTEESIRSRVERVRDVEVSFEDFKYVQEILPKRFIPKYPLNIPPESPTPSGWFSPKPYCASMEYYVERNKIHEHPIHLKSSHLNRKNRTILYNVCGDIWKLRDDLHSYLNKDSDLDKDVEVYNNFYEY
ncbi:MAG: 54S ribosomal protein L49, mitochondrial [Paramarteilia canceri]